MPSIWALPDDVILHIFELLGGVRERQTSVALVCRHWRDLAVSPELVHDVAVCLRWWSAQDRAEEGWAEAALGWLERYVARHARRLSFTGLYRLHMSCLSDSVSTFVEACCGGGSVADLALTLENNGGRLTMGSAYRTHPEAQCLVIDVGASAAPACLRQLSIRLPTQIDEDTVHFGGPLLWMSGLTSLHLEAHRPTLEGGLPPLLERLCLGGGMQEPQTISKVSALTGLTSLSLDGPSSAEECSSFTALGACTSLRRLRLADAFSLPPRAVLARLSALTALYLHNSRLHHSNDDPEGAEPQALQDTLPAVPQLVQLSVSHYNGCAPPAALAGLVQLSRLRWTVGEGNVCAPLPAGVWLSGLRQLTVFGCVAAASLAALGTAQRLEQLCLLEFYSKHNVEALEAAAQLPRLRQLSLRLAPSSAQPTRAVEAARRQRPGLDIRYLPYNNMEVEEQGVFD